MKRRIRKIVNFFAFNLLFFALYLNFIHKDKGIAEPMPIKANTATINGTIPVQDAGKYLNAKSSAATAQPSDVKVSEETAQKLTIN